MHKISKFFFFLSSFKFWAAITAVKLLLLFRNLLQLFLWLHHNFTRHQLPSLKPAPPLFSFFFFLNCLVCFTLRLTSLQSVEINFVCLWEASGNLLMVPVLSSEPAPAVGAFCTCVVSPLWTYFQSRVIIAGTVPEDEQLIPNRITLDSRISPHWGGVSAASQRGHISFTTVQHWHFIFQLRPWFKDRH